MSSSATTTTMLNAPEPSTKNKGGRPALHTPEQRKQRNRAAQAAFRERRTEYIKELEDEAVARSADLRRLLMEKEQKAEECLMLRYKNSLLERILVEKGVDVKRELGTIGDRNVEMNWRLRKRVREEVSLTEANGRTKKSCHGETASLRSPVSSTTESTLALASSPPAREALFVPATAENFTPPSVVFPNPPTPISPPNPASVQPQKSSDYSTLTHSISNHLNSNTITPSRSAAHFYLTSFLAHIESLGKFFRPNCVPELPILD